MLEIMLAGNKKEYAPGETIEGTVRWSRTGEPPAGLVVALMYETEGKGTQDRVHVEELDMRAAAISGEEGFRFKAPASPYTFNGTLISLRWHIEASADEEDTVTVPIVLSPWVETLRLKQLAEPGPLELLKAMKEQQEQQQQ